jgi:hypothetical protein
METVIIYPKNKEQLSALKAFAKALKIDFEIKKSPYNPEFAAKIKKSLKRVKAGEYITLDPNKSLWENIMTD